MRIKNLVRSFLVMALASSALFATANLASAHVDKEAGQGLSLAIGFGAEPAYSGQPNSVQVLLSQDGEPVTDLTDELSVAVSYGDQTTDLGALEPYFEIGEWGTPGDYRAWFVPSQAGAYTFRVTGEMRGVSVDESVTSSESTFSSVKDISESEFPQAPSTSDQLAARLTARADGAKSLAESSLSSANSAKTLAYVGIAIGLMGIAVAIAALASSRKKA